MTVKITPIGEAWYSMAIIMLRNGHTVTEMQTLLSKAADKVIEEQRQEAERQAQWKRQREAQK